MSRPFDISPEKEASTSQYLYRQLFVTPAVLSKKEFNLTGKTAIVTGSNIGLDLECARQLLDLGLSKLILAVRDESKGETARKELSICRSLAPGAIEVWKVDLSSYNSIIKFAERAHSLEYLDIAVLNAGVYKVNLTFNPATGFEEDVRIIIVSSDTAAWAKFNERIVNPLLPAFKAIPSKWDMQERYSTSKLLGQLLFRDGAGTLLGLVIGIITRIIGRPCNVGARPLTAAAVKFGDEVHGQYVEDNKIRPMAPIIYKPEGQRIAKKLWQELLDELSFAGVRDVLKGLKK
ncbi:uncharacterized protein ATNIH1004_001264 [Aspergillus tanneri]|uniref:NAD(P)-binding protein n=1 Tax=Aspergillus tanneri TaxID=1220188 RepID=A0A5M9N3S6_9EURO|nr:uncharacterized protein ATNIH1004_001264 [Aspergillus tanneri]KAA8652360.1 hypothetical protein ATNIH1004_001264 [Aspergillus tanneri]